MEEIQIAIKRVRPGGAPASLPAYMTEGAAGMDLGKRTRASARHQATRQIQELGGRRGVCHVVQQMH